MKQRNFFLAVVALFFGVFVFAFSLISASQKEEMHSEKVSTKQLYVGETILPDHVFYPVLMVLDRGLLMVTSDEARVMLRIRFANDRMMSARKLLEKGNEPLALSTLTKSQKYLILAVHEFLQAEYSDSVGVALYLALQDNTEQLLILEKKFSVLPTGPIGDLIFESTTLLPVLESKVRN